MLKKKIRNLLFAISVFFACAVLLATQVLAADSPREHLSLDANWKFHLGDDWQNALHLDKAGAKHRPGGGQV